MKGETAPLLAAKHEASSGPALLLLDLFLRLRELLAALVVRLLALLALHFVGVEDALLVLEAQARLLPDLGRQRPDDASFRVLARRQEFGGDVQRGEHLGATLRVYHPRRIGIVRFRAARLGDVEILLTGRRRRLRVI